MDFEEFRNLDEDTIRKLEAKALADYDQFMSMVQEWATDNLDEWKEIGNRQMALIGEEDSREGRIIDLAWIGHKLITSRIIGIEEDHRDGDV